MAKTAVKAATKKTNGSTSMVKWEEEMARQADIAAAVTSVASGTFVSFRGGILTIDKTPMPGAKIEAVITNHCFENAYYDQKWDEDNPVPPVCFAFGVAKPGMSAAQLEAIESSMVPHEKSTKPQSKSCAT